MKYNYIPKSNIEKFGVKVHDLLVENFPQTFFVGGMVRDLLLGRKVVDIDMATEALPQDVIKILDNNGIKFYDRNNKFGSVTAKHGKYGIEITTFRKDLKADTRYPAVKFIKSVKNDSERRDFTVNSLYLSPKTGNILDFHNGLMDLKNRIIRFIGNPDRRIKEDPLRIIRALRFSLSLDFKLEKKTYKSIQNNLFLVGRLTGTRRQKEINKLIDRSQKINLENILAEPKLLDKYLK